MKRFRFYLILGALILLGGLLGMYLALSHVNPANKYRPVSGKHPLTKEIVFDFPAPDTKKPEASAPEFPQGSIHGEYVIHFSSRKDYLAYIAALMAAGRQPLSQIDELLAVRIPSGALLSVNFGSYAGRASYSYEVQRPLAPIEIDPVALNSLRGFGAPARSIVNGTPHGDGSGVIVGILDSGIHTHPQFDNVYIVDIDLVGGVDTDRGASHGTAVASIIAGSNGVAPNAELFVVRVLDDEGKGNSYHVAEGIVQAVDLGVKVINLSLGVYQDSILLRQAIKYADEKGVLLVAAAGNDSYSELPYPAAYEEVLSVTALDAGGSHAVFPNQSKQIDFAAPGVGILVAAGDSGVDSFSGTSAAAPFVSGTLASLMSGEQAMAPKEAVELLRRYLNDSGAPGADPEYGAGALDWVRLRERGTPGILDIALAGIHLDPAAQPGTNMPIEVTVQNRGTKWFTEAQLEVLINEADPIGFTIGALGPGQTTTRKVFAQVPTIDSEQTLNLAASVLPEDLSEDVRLENNLKAVQYRPK